MTKSACDSTCHEHIVNLCSQYYENVDIYNSEISNHRKVVTRLNKVRFFDRPPTCLGKKSGLIIYPTHICDCMRRFRSVALNLSGGYGRSPTLINGCWMPNDLRRPIGWFPLTESQMLYPPLLRWGRHSSYRCKSLHSFDFLGFRVISMWIPTFGWWSHRQEVAFQLFSSIQFFSWSLTL
jgi:hypothetical protein